MHGHATIPFNAAEVLHGSGGRLPQQRKAHDQLAGPPRVLRVAGRLVVLQGPLEDVLEVLDRLRVFDVY